MDEPSYRELLHMDAHPSDEWVEGWRRLPEFREFEARLISHIKRAPRGSCIPVTPRDSSKTGWVLRIMDWWLWYSGDPDAAFCRMSDDYSHLHKG